MLNVYEQHSKRKLLATILSIVVIAGSVVFADHIKNTGQMAETTTTNSTSTKTESSSPTTSTTASTTTAPASTSSTSSLKDGSYTATSSYYVPHGDESIDVSLTLKDGVITDVSIVNSEGDHESVVYQQDFASVYKSYVVGKSISSLELGIVAGASDTTQGFEDALSQITAQAQA